MSNSLDAKRYPEDAVYNDLGVYCYKQKAALRLLPLLFRLFVSCNSKKMLEYNFLGTTSHPVHAAAEQLAYLA